MKTQIDTKELLRLTNRDLKLQALESGGVDNWEWYGESIDNYTPLKSLPEYGVDFDIEFESEQRLFYNNTNCYFVTYLSKELAVVKIELEPDFDIDTSSHCAGCMIGDSDNKISCRCEDVQNILEDVQDNTPVTIIPLIVETSKLYKKPIIIQKHQKQLDDIKNNKDIEISKTKELMKIQSKLKSEIQELEQNKKDLETLDSFK